MGDNSHLANAISMKSHLLNTNIPFTEQHTLNAPFVEFFKKSSPHQKFLSFGVPTERVRERTLHLFFLRQQQPRNKTEQPDNFPISTFFSRSKLRAKVKVRKRNLLVPSLISSSREEESKLLQFQEEPELKTICLW